MNFIWNFPFLTIIFSLSSGVICSVLKRKNARRLCFTVLSAILVMSILTLFYTIQLGEPYVYFMGHFSAPWGNEIKVGILECLMASVFALVMILSLLGGLNHINHDVDSHKENLYYTMIMLLTSSLLSIVYTNDIFTGYVFVEINTIASCALVMIRYKSGKALVATLRYLIMSLLGSGLFLLGICTLYSITGHLLMENIAISVKELVTTGQYLFPLAVVVALFSMGLALKSACFPFHTWLPDAHSNATVSSSSVLSGLVLKGYIFLLIKIFYRVLRMDVVSSTHTMDILFVFGVLAMIYGSLRAIKEKDMKRMLAYSSVAQVGYIYFGIGLGSVAGMSAAIMQIIVHALTKPMLFTSAGCFMDVSHGSKKFADLKGAGLKDKVAGAAFVVGSLSMIGIPFFAGFIPKVYLSLASLEVLNLKMIVGLMALIISTLLNACYYIPAIYTLFDGSSLHKDESNKLSNKLAHISLIVFMISNLLVGVCSSSIYSLIVQGLSMFA